MNGSHFFGVKRPHHLVTTFSSHKTQNQFSVTGMSETGIPEPAPLPIDRNHAADIEVPTIYSDSPIGVHSDSGHNRLSTR